MTKKQAVANGADGLPEASEMRVGDLGQTPKEYRAQIASFVGMEYEDERNNSRSHADMVSCNRDHAESVDETDAVFM